MTDASMMLSLYSSPMILPSVTVPTTVLLPTTTVSLPGLAEDTVVSAALQLLNQDETQHHSPSLTTLGGCYDSSSERDVPSGPCSACGLAVLDRYFLRVAGGGVYHEGCLRCAMCSIRLDHEVSCFFEGSVPLCRNDYTFRRSAIESSAQSCAACGLLIPARDMAHRVYSLCFHVHCFRCQHCGVPLQRGEPFNVDGDRRLSCQAHMERRLPSLRAESTEPAMMSLGRRIKEDSEGPEDVHSDEGTLRGGGDGGGRTKRMRTSFKHHQLKQMKQYFDLNHNPDAKDLKNLSNKTGLSKRVLQVWFQNARAKHRRSAAGRGMDMSGMGGVSPGFSSGAAVKTEVQSSSVSSGSPQMQFSNSSPDETAYEMHHVNL